MDGNYGIYLLLQGVSTSAAKEAKIFSTLSIKNKAFISDQEVCVLLFHFVSDIIFGQTRRYLWRYLAELLTRGGCTNEYLFLLGLSLKVKLMSLIFKYGIFQMGAVVKKKKTCFPSLARIHNFTDDNCGWLCVIPMLWLRTLTSFSFY